MNVSVKTISCPNCGAPQGMDTKECMYCGSEIIIRTFNSVSSMPVPQLKKYVASYTQTLAQDGDNADVMLSIALCYMKLKIYAKAAEFLNKAMDICYDNPHIYFYAAMCIFQGKRPFFVTRQVIDKAEEFLNAALSISNEGIFSFFLAYIRFDYHARKGFNVNPSYKQYLLDSARDGVSRADKLALFESLGVEVPPQLMV